MTSHDVLPKVIASPACQAQRFLFFPRGGGFRIVGVQRRSSPSLECVLAARVKLGRSCILSLGCVVNSHGKPEGPRFFMMEFLANLLDLSVLMCD